MEYSYYVLVSIEGNKITKWWSGDDLTGKMGLIPFAQYMKKNAAAAGRDLNNFEVWHFLQGVIEKIPLETWMENNKKEVTG